MLSNIFIKSLEKIGTKLSDFEEVPNQKKNLSYYVLGKGNFGYAEKMKSRKNGLYYAIKKLVKTKLNLKNFHRETEIMFNLNHENIVKFYGYFEDKEKITKYKEIYQEKKDIQKEVADKNIYCLILEYIPNGSLNDYIIKNKPYFKNNVMITLIKEEFIIRIFKQLLNALIYLFSKSILHRDIKPDNLLLDENYNIKISDFGLSALYRDENPQNMNKPNYLFGKDSIVGRYDYISPEVLKGQKYDLESDIFCLGLTMLTLVSIDNPILLFMDTIAKKPKRKIDYNKINKCYNKYLINLILLMINEDPKMRPTAQQAYDNLIQIEKMNINDDKKIQRNLTFPNNKGFNNKNINEFLQPLNEFDNSINPNSSNKDNNNNFINRNFLSAEIKPTIFKNTSLIRSIQCLCRCVKENIKSKLPNNVNNSISLDIINIMEITKLKLSDKIDKLHFIQSIKDFRTKLSSKIEEFKKDEDISPKKILYYLIILLNNDFKANKINWNNDLLNGFIEPANLPKKSFPHIYEKVEIFKKDFKSPFVDNFYFISLVFIKCPKCNCLLQSNAHTSYMIPLAATRKDKISNLINNYINSTKTVEIKCNKCFDYGVKINGFFTTPKYLMLFFEGEPKKEKIIEEIIDIGSSCYSNIGYKRYNLYGFITKDTKDNEYKAIFKNEHDNNWFLYSDIDSINKFGFNFKNYYFPTIVIYKGFN
jgi:serine/threonine protein kinase